MMNQYPYILAIDTSCDDTSAAVVHGYTVLSNIVSSQTEIHRPYGGVFPTMAKQAHKQNINPAIKRALKLAQITKNQLDAIAVTVGPGLAPALEIGIHKAKKISSLLRLPLIKVNHIEGHLLSILTKPNNKKPMLKNFKPPWPILGIIVSGGHTEYVWAKNFGDYQILGQTVDDAAGECLDKVGRLLSLGYPAAPVVERLAKQGNANKFSFPLPMTSSGDLNLSFSGLKTFSRRKIEELEKNGKLNKQTTFDFCASLQNGVFKHIAHKLNKLLKQFHPNEIWLGGGVANNIKLRKIIRKLAKEYNLKVLLPYRKKICSDNAAMIGVVSYFKYQKKEFVTNSSSMDRIPQWKIDQK